MADATFTIYKEQGTSGRYRWRLEAPNHKITADSGYSYESPSAVATAIATVKTEVANAKVYDATGGQ